MNTGDTEESTERALAKERLRLERERFEFQKQSDETRLQLDHERNRQARREAWLRTFGGAVLVAFITAGVTIYGIVAEQQRTARAAEEQRLRAQESEKNRRSQTLVQLVNARETADTNLRARMFEALLVNYFTQTDKDDQISRITILKLMALNFRDAIQVKPLFEALDRQTNNSELLRDAARVIINDQLNQIRMSKNGAVCEVELTTDSELVVPSCFPLLAIRLMNADITDEFIEVRTNTKNGSLLPSGISDEGDTFNVNYFDMPMIDFTGVTAGGNEMWRYSIVLEDIHSPDRATATVAILPYGSYSTQHEYKFDELLSDYIEFDRSPP